MPPAFSISELRCVDMPISQKLIVETESGPVEWRRINRTNVAWATRRCEAMLGSGIELSRERASVAFLWHLAAILDGGPQEDLYEAFGAESGDVVELFWQEWSERHGQEAPQVLAAVASVGEQLLGPDSRRGDDGQQSGPSVSG